MKSAMKSAMKLTCEIKSGLWGYGDRLFFFSNVSFFSLNPFPQFLENSFVPFSLPRGEDCRSLETWLKT